MSFCPCSSSKLLRVLVLASFGRSTCWKCRASGPLHALDSLSDKAAAELFRQVVDELTDSDLARLVGARAVACLDRLLAKSHTGENDGQRVH